MSKVLFSLLLLISFSFSLSLKDKVESFFKDLKTANYQEELKLEEKYFPENKALVDYLISSKDYKDAIVYLRNNIYNRKNLLKLIKLYNKFNIKDEWVISYLKYRVSVSKLPQDKYFFSKILIEYGGPSYIEKYGSFLSKEELLKICKEANSISSLKSCFLATKDGIFYEGIYNIMSQDDIETTFWLKDHLSDVFYNKEKAYLVLGLLSYFQKDIKSAVKYFEKAGKEGEYRLAILYFNIGQKEKAKKIALKLLKENIPKKEQETLEEIIKNS